MTDQKGKEIELERMLKAVKNDAVQRLNKAATTNLHILNEVLPAAHVINAQHQKITIERPTVMVFADDAPLLNWGHPCRYLLYKAENGEMYNEIKAEFPPYLLNPPPTFELFHELVPPRQVIEWHPTLIDKLPSPYRFRTGARYAVLFSGASNNRHVNDLEFLYRTLIDKYGFVKDNIYVLNYNGKVDYSGGPHPVGTWPGDHTAYHMKVRGQGTKAAFEKVIDELKGRIKASDTLLIHTNNHGGYDAAKHSSYLCTYDGVPYYANDFANKLAELPACHWLMVLMEQCHAGGFNAPILAKSKASATSVASACREDRSSIGGAEFDPFARDWISAMMGHTPYSGPLAYNPDTGSGRVEADEAFRYANTVKDPYDTPVFSQKNLGGKAYLGEWWILLPFAVQAIEKYGSLGADPETVSKMRNELPARLAETGFDKELDKRLEQLQKELAPHLQAMVDETVTAR
jgi:hypothetical protein